MYERKIPENYECGINVAMKVLGGKWKACIVDSINRGIKRPSALHRELSSSSPRVINMQLRELEEDGIIGKIVYPGLPLKVEYYLTGLGQSILPVITALDKWGSENREQVIGISEELQAESFYSMEPQLMD
jgi:DNA-binding HxlR family transcriptional regulator